MKPNEAPFVISRNFDAPRNLMWRAWTESDRLTQWWGPKGFVVRTCEVDLKPGGMFLYGMKATDGSDMWGRFIYRTIEPPRRLVFVVSFSDLRGGISRHPGHMGWPLQMLCTVSFEEKGNGTRVTVHSEPFGATEDEGRTFYGGRDSMTQGWSGTLEQLQGYLAGSRLERA